MFDLFDFLFFDDLNFQYEFDFIANQQRWPHHRDEGEHQRAKVEEQANGGVPN